MKCASAPSRYRNCIRRTSVRTGRNFSPARKVRSITFPSLARRSFVRTNAPPLPGLTCWNSTILKTVLSTSMWLPLRNWLVEIKVRQCSSRTVGARWRQRVESPDGQQILRQAREDLAAALGHDDQVLDPHAEAPGYVHPGLDRNHVAGVQPVLGALRESRALVDL